MLTIDDIDFNMYGFSINKIKRASDKKLNTLMDELSENVVSVSWTNVDDMGILSVRWLSTMFISDEQKQETIKVLNKLFRTN